ncbi:phage head-tail joining protein [Vannielia litorea]|uniref:phage head-tail joining protein n=1 Tax=Vannielia litorea TaxID=1217970 RepID=UPI001BD0F7F2|nr:hypothetical protein [Vannielia litorea]MBS8228414.1 hypothetical protein [Vannielia litorea]
MAYTQADLTELQRNMAKGLKVAQVGGERVEFRTLAEMQRLETRIKRELGESIPATFQTIRTETGWR